MKPKKQGNQSEAGNKFEKFEEVNDVSYDSAEFEDEEIKDPDLKVKKAGADETATRSEEPDNQTKKNDPSKTFDATKSLPDIEQDPVANYKVELNPKLRNQTYSMLEKKIIEDKPTVETKEELRQVEKVFKMIHEFAVENLNVGPN